MNLKVYAYKNCSTCQKALRFLEGRSYELLPIVEQPPSLDELQRIVVRQLKLPATTTKTPDEVFSNMA